MKHITLLISVMFMIGYSIGQDSKIAYDQCEGSLNIFSSDNFNLKFLGRKGESRRFTEYPALSEISSPNQIWFSFIAPKLGAISLRARTNDELIEFAVFESSGSNICSEISDGLAEIKRVIVGNETTTLGLDSVVNNNFLFPLNIEAGKVYYFVVIAKPESKATLNLDFTFTSIEEVSEVREMDFRTDDFAPSFEFHIRDKETGEPLVAALSVRNTKCIDGMYKASDLYFNLTRNGKMSFSCEMEGYFFIDSNDINVYQSKNQSIEIELEPVRSGKSIQLEEIEFKPGTSEFLPGSELRLRRLKDFMALNATVTIEIQGHVYEPGDENSYTGQKISEARAKRVMKYLIDCGIDKSRMTAVGYGNTKPIYPNPTIWYEEQANRRVEIVVK